MFLSDALDNMDFPLALCSSLLQGGGTVGKRWDMSTWLSEQKPILTPVSPVRTPILQIN